MSKTWLSPAKINLFLHIISKRNDGYHNLESIFQLLDFGDEMSFDINNNSQISRVDNRQNHLPDEDLCVKSARLLQLTIGTKKGVTINIKKNIPIGGGLGGGSSNAATTLVALNQLWQANLTNNQLMELGLKLGADVGFFINGVSAWASGIGEILTKMHLPKHYFLLVFINKFISTGEIFAHTALTKTPAIGKMTDFSNLQAPHNDCLLAAIDLESEVLEVINHLKTAKNYLFTPRMSGSGSTVFLEFENKKDAEAARDNLPQKWQSVVAKALNTSPIYNWTVAKW